MKSRGLRTVIYYVPDLKAAKEWYAKAFDTEPYFDEPYYTGFEIGGYELGLHPATKDLQTGNNIAVYWGVENMEAAHAELIRQGATEYEKPTEVGEGIIVAAVKDPWGNIIGLIYNPHFRIKEE
jgi:lactoylglutathione lyase